MVNHDKYFIHYGFIICEYSEIILTSAFLIFTLEISGRFFNSEMIFIAFPEIICKRSNEKNI